MRKLGFVFIVLLVFNFVSFQIRNRVFLSIEKPYFRLQDKFIVKLAYYSSFKNRFANPQKLFDIKDSSYPKRLYPIKYYLQKFKITQYTAKPLFYGEWNNYLVGILIIDEHYYMRYYFYFEKYLHWPEWKHYAPDEIAVYKPIDELIKTKKIAGIEVFNGNMFHDFLIFPQCYEAMASDESGLLLDIKEIIRLKKYEIMHACHVKEECFCRDKFSKVFSIDNVPERFRDKVKLTFKEYAEYYFYVLLENYFGELEIIWKFVWAIFVGIVVWQAYRSKLKK